MDQDTTWYGGRPRPRQLSLRWGPRSPSPKRGQSPLLPAFPQFSAHVYCGQTAAWIKMPLGSEIGLGPDDIVLDGDPAPPPQQGGGAPSPIFGPCLLWPNGWMDQDGTWHGRGPWSRPHCTRWDPAPPLQKGAERPNFQPVFVVKRLDASTCHLVWR